MKLTVALTMFSLFVTLFAAELTVQSPGELLFGETLTMQDGAFVADKVKPYYSKKQIDIDLAKSYRLSGEFKAAPGSSGKVPFRFGIVPATHRGGQLSPRNFNIVPDTETELIAAVEPKDTVIRIKDGAKWKALPATLVAFDVDPTGKRRDLPNYKLSPVGIKSVSANGDGYDVTLNAPVGKSWPAGTSVRQHVNSWGCIYVTTGNKPVGEEWTVFELTLPPGEVGEAVLNRWWLGTQKAGFVIETMAVPAGDGLMFRNLKLEELPDAPNQDTK